MGDWAWNEWVRGMDVFWIGGDPESLGWLLGVLIRLAAVRHRSENYGLAFDIIAKAVHADSEPPLAFAFGDTVKFS